jgi:hypothetical protein
MNEENRIYPSLTEIDKVEVLNKINSQRAEKLLSIIKSKQEKLEHYEKVFKRWRNLHKTLRILNICGTSLVGASICVLGFLSTGGIAIPVLAIAILGGYGTIESTILEGMNVGLIKQKKERFRNKIDIIKTGINKMYYFYEKARQDNKITLDEIEQFNVLLKELENSLASNELAKVNVNDKINFLELQKEASIIAKKEAQAEIKQKLIKEAKDKLVLTASTLT